MHSPQYIYISIFLFKIEIVNDIIYAMQESRLQRHLWYYKLYCIKCC